MIALPLVPLAAATSESGGKAASLARLAAAGLPVPPGWIVPADVPDANLGTAAGHLAAWAAGAAPYGLIARSSAPGEDGQAASFAGLFTSCFAASDGISEAIARVRASRTEPTAAAYARRAGLEPPTGMPVLVQPALRPYAAGVATAETSGGHATRWRIEAVHGLAEPLVNGTCTGEAHHGEAGEVTTRPAAQRRLVIPGTLAELMVPPGDMITITHPRLGPSALKVAHSAGSIVEFYRPPAWAAAPVLEDEDRDRIVALASAAASALPAARIDIEWALLPDGSLWLVQGRPLTAPLPPPDFPGGPGGALWQGLPGSPGRAQGPATRLGEAPSAPGAVLICPALDAGSVTALLEDPAAIVAATGGTLSHTAIVARELGIPAVVRVTGAMTLFSPGQYLDVDGTAGTVRRAAAPQSAVHFPGPGPGGDSYTATCVLSAAAPESPDGEFRAVIIDADGPASAPAVFAALDTLGPRSGILVIDPRSVVPTLPPAYRVTEPARLTRLITAADTPARAALAARDRDGTLLHKRPGQATGWQAAGDYLPAPAAAFTRRIVGPFDLVATRSWRYHGGEVWEVSADGTRYIVKRHSDSRHWRQEVAGYQRAAALTPLRAPRLIGADEDLTVIITTLLPGADLDGAALGLDEQREAYRQAGALLRSLHVPSSGPDTSIPGRLTAKAHAALAGARQSLTSSETAVITSQIACMEQISAWLPAVATHGDFQPRNLLWDPATRVLGVIDFEKAALAPAARDIASITAAVPQGRDDLSVAFYQGLGREPHGRELAAVTAFTVLTALTDYAWGQENGDHSAVSAARGTFARHARHSQSHVMTALPDPT